MEIKIDSSFRDRTCSWVRIVNGINKYVTETSEEISYSKCWREEYRATCCEGLTTTDIDLDVVSCVYSV